MTVTYWHGKRRVGIFFFSTALMLTVYKIYNDIDKNMFLNNTVKIQTKDSRKYEYIPTILIYDQHPLHWFSSFDLKRKCPLNCLFTTNSKLYSTSEAIIFFQFLTKHPPLKLSHQKWLFLSNESPVHLGAISTNIAWRNASSKIDWLLSYRPGADFVFKFGNLIRDTKIYINYSMVFSKKTKEVAWVVSNCGAHSLRDQYVTELKKYITVDIYGRCGTRKCPNPRKREGDSTNCKTLISTEYKFYLSFENSICENYITEKVYGVYQKDNMMIPVVRSAPNISFFLPAGTYISTSDFKSPRKLAEYLLKVGSSEKTFTSILKEKHKFKQIPWLTNYRQAICDLCLRLHSPNKGYYKGGNVYQRLLKDKCYRPHDIVS